jgi:hypothetical protein
MAGGVMAWQVGQEVVLRKQHPCGGRRWTIYKLGMDMGLQCRHCGQRIKLARRQFDRAIAPDAAQAEYQLRCSPDGR